jgi:hypothetical protein
VVSNVFSEHLGATFLLTKQLLPLLAEGADSPWISGLQIVQAYCSGAEYRTSQGSKSTLGTDPPQRASVPGCFSKGRNVLNESVRLRPRRTKQSEQCLKGDRWHVLAF